MMSPKIQIRGLACKGTFEVFSSGVGRRMSGTIRHLPDFSPPAFRRVTIFGWAASGYTLFSPGSFYPLLRRWQNSGSCSSVALQLWPLLRPVFFWIIRPPFQFRPAQASMVASCSLRRLPHRGWLYSDSSRIPAFPGPGRFPQACHLIIDRACQWCRFL